MKVAEMCEGSLRTSAGCATNPQVQQQELWDART